MQHVIHVVYQKRIRTLNSLIIRIFRFNFCPLTQKKTWSNFIKNFQNHANKYLHYPFREYSCHNTRKRLPRLNFIKAYWISNPAIVILLIILAVTRDEKKFGFQIGPQNQSCVNHLLVVHPLTLANPRRFRIYELDFEVRWTWDGREFLGFKLQSGTVEFISSSH